MARLLVQHGAALTSTGGTGSAEAARTRCVLDIHGRCKPSAQAEAVLRYIMQVRALPLTRATMY
jgi:hypothetical protein